MFPDAPGSRPSFSNPSKEASQRGSVALAVSKPGGVAEPVTAIPLEPVQAEDTPTVAPHPNDAPPPPAPTTQSAHARRKSVAVVIPPQLLRPGVEMLKVSAKSAKKFKSKRVWIERGLVTEEQLGLKGTNVGAGSELDVRICWEKGGIGVGSKREAHIPISALRDLRFGTNGAPYRTSLHLSPDVESRWITLIYVVPHAPSSSPLAILSPTTPSYKLVHFIAPTEDVLEMWKSVLEKLRDVRVGKGLIPNLIQGGDAESDVDSDSEKRVVKVEEVQKLCAKLGMGLGKEEIKQAFKETAAPQDFLDFRAFQKFVKVLKRREDIAHLFGTIVGQDTKKSMDLVKWSSFLRDSQESTATEETIKTWYSKYADPVEGCVSVEGFSSFLCSSHNTAVQDDMSQDMTKPLSDYYINSSHNTYLMGNQIQGESHVEGYIRALQQGCRCVELDVWDGDDGIPVITHGHTFTSKILASDALAAIAQYAFLSSTYPLILSLEMHCETPQQDKLAEILVEKLGERLVKERIDDKDGEIKVLPSPWELRGRILLKAKNLFLATSTATTPLATVTPEVDSSTETSSSSDSADLSLRRALSRVRKSFDDRRPPYLSRSPPSRPSFQRATSSSNTAVLLSSSPQPTESALSGSSLPVASTSSSTSSSSSSSSSKPPMSMALASMIVYTIGVKARGFNKKEKYDVTHVLSFGEKKLLKMAKEESMRQDFISHNRTHLTRAYPKGIRLTSTNYLPNHLWGLGVQMVAVNWQTFDTGMQLNKAMFSRGGRSGYVLKPPILREKGPTKDKEALVQTATYSLSLEVISAQQLPRTKESTSSAPSHADALPPMDTFVEITLFLPSQLAPIKRRTKVVSGNAFNPIFNSSFDIPFTILPAEGFLDLVFLKFSVLDSKGNTKAAMEDGKGDFVGAYSVGLGGLLPGYRHLPLYDSIGDQHLYSSIFIKSKLSKVSETIKPPPLSTSSSSSSNGLLRIRS